jgi:hypothetical protein
MKGGQIDEDDRTDLIGGLPCRSPPRNPQREMMIARMMQASSEMAGDAVLGNALKDLAAYPLSLKIIIFLKTKKRRIPG